MFALYFDEELKRKTPYHEGGSYFAKAKDRMDRTFSLIQPEVAGKVVVDVGASPFYLLDCAKKAGAAECHGLYFSYDEHPLKNSKAIYSEHGAIHLNHANIENEKLPFEDDSVDIITACEILEHCEYFPVLFSQEIRRVLKPGGLLCITVPNVCSIANIAKLILQRNIYMKYRSDSTGRHKHEFTHRQLTDFIGYLKMDIVKSGFFPSPTSDLYRLRPIYRMIAATPVLKTYSPNLYILARQPVNKPLNDLTVPPQTMWEQSLSIED
jgi:ubiquinone/menaquinone biosynthesis C-methylase UbiE